MRGGVSQAARQGIKPGQSSPHAWGCFRAGAGRKIVGGVFPTCVGVFLQLTKKQALVMGLPHMRGGVSYSCELIQLIRISSPHAWGCFWYSQSHRL